MVSKMTVRKAQHLKISLATQLVAEKTKFLETGNENKRENCRDTLETVNFATKALTQCSRITSEVGWVTGACTENNGQSQN